jgi:hypothetical protein
VRDSDCTASPLREGLAVLAAVAKIGRRDGTTAPVLPIDRVFTIKGHGTVVTGTLLAGAVDLRKDEARGEHIVAARRAAASANGIRLPAKDARGRVFESDAVARRDAGQTLAVLHSVHAEHTQALHLDPFRVATTATAMTATPTARPPTIHGVFDEAAAGATGGRCH